MARAATPQRPPPPATPTPGQQEAARLNRLGGLLQFGSSVLSGAVTWWALAIVFNLVGIKGFAALPCLTMALAPPLLVAAVAGFAAGPKPVYFGRFIAILQTTTLLMFDPVTSAFGFFAWRGYAKASATLAAERKAAA